MEGAVTQGWEGMQLETPFLLLCRVPTSAPDYTVEMTRMFIVCFESQMPLLDACLGN